MDALALVLVFLGLMALAFTYARYAPQRRATFSEVAKRLTIGAHAAAAIIGTNLIPAMREATRAAMEFEQTYIEQAATMEEVRTE